MLQNEKTVKYKKCFKCVFGNLVLQLVGEKALPPPLKLTNSQISLPHNIEKNRYY